MLSGIVEMINEAGKRVYNCNGVLCICDSCSQGREIKSMTGGGVELIEIATDYFRELVPRRRNEINIMYVDGTEEIIKEFKDKVKGCENKK